MNQKNVKEFVKRIFLTDGIKAVDVYIKVGKKYYVQDDFKNYLNDLSLSSSDSFLNFCKERLEFENSKNLDNLKKKIIRKDIFVEEENLDNLTFLYNWYLKDTLQKLLRDDFNFFVEIVKENERKNQQSSNSIDIFLSNVS